MTKDAYYKAESIMKDLDTVSDLQNLFANATLCPDNDYHRPQNDRIRKQNVRLCFLQDVVGHTPLETFELDGRKTIASNCVPSKDIPVELVKLIQGVLNDYEAKLNKEMEELDANYYEEELF